MNSHSTDLNVVLSCIDLTSLAASDSPQSITDLVNRGLGISPRPAAICVFPEFVDVVTSILKTGPGIDFGICTVVNFPSGNNDVAHIREETLGLLLRHTPNLEIDVVWDFERWNSGNKERAILPIRTVMECIAGSACKIKVIMETSAISNVYEAACFILDSFPIGVAFLKTSTGKHSTGGATVAAAKDILAAITYKNRTQATGLKVSGGVRTCQDALIYLELVRRDTQWPINSSLKNKFRIGASVLVSDIEIQRKELSTK